MNKRPDFLVNMDLNELTDFISDSDAEMKSAKKTLEATESMLKDARVVYSEAKKYNDLLRDFTRALLSERNPEKLENIRAKYQKAFARITPLQSKEEDRAEVQGKVSDLMGLIQQAAEGIVEQVKPTTKNDPEPA